MKKFFLICFLFAAQIYSQNIAGSGTAVDPYLLYNVADMDSISTLMTARGAVRTYFVLDRDLDFTGVTWTPISWSTLGMSISFDGRYHRIKHLDDIAIQRYRGLFGYTVSTPSVWERIIFDSCNVSSESSTQYTSLLLGVSASTGDLIKNVYVRNSSITQINANNTGVSFSTGTAFIAGRIVGGLISQCNVANSSIYVTASASHVIGGIVGQMSAGTISECFVNANLQGISGGAASMQVGSFAGGIDGCTGACTRIISNSYSRSNLYGGFDPYGGAMKLFGLIYTTDNYGNYNYSNNYVANTYTDGTYESNGVYVGSDADLEFVATFIDTQYSGIDTMASTGSLNLSYSPRAKTTAEMKTESTFTDSAWDFTNIWAIDGAINDGYPYLRNSPIDIPDALPALHYLTLIYPAGNELFNSGDTVSIKLTAYPVISSYNYYYSTNAGLSWTFIQNSPDTSLNWVVPEITTSKARILVTGVDSINVYESNSFTIQGEHYFINILSPENLNSDVSTVPIVWESINVNKFNLFYSSDSLSWTSIDTGFVKEAGDGFAPDTTTYMWTLPSSIGSLYVKVESDTSISFPLNRTDWTYAGDRAHYFNSQGPISHSPYFYMGDQLYTVWFYAYIWGWYDTQDQVGITRFNTADSTWQIINSESVPSYAYYPSFSTRLVKGQSTVQFFLYNDRKHFISSNDGTDPRYTSWQITPLTGGITLLVKDENDDPPSNNVSNSIVSYLGYDYFGGISNGKTNGVIYAQNKSSGFTYVYANTEALPGIVDEYFVADNLLHVSVRAIGSGEYADYVMGTIPLASDEYASDVIKAFTFHLVYRDSFRGIYPKATKHAREPYKSTFK